MQFICVVTPSKTVQESQLPPASKKIEGRLLPSQEARCSGVTIDALLWLGLDEVCWNPCQGAAPSLCPSGWTQETLQAASQACLAFPYMEFSLRCKGMIATSSVASREQMTLTMPWDLSPSKS